MQLSKSKSLPREEAFRITAVGRQIKNWGLKVGEQGEHPFKKRKAAESIVGEQGGGGGPEVTHSILCQGWG